MDIKEVLRQWFTNFFDTKSTAKHPKTSGGPIKSKNISNHEIAKELHNTINRKFKKCKG